MIHAFRRGGVHPPEEKHLTAAKPIEVAPLPARVVLALSQHVGAPAKAVVKAKDVVRVGQLVGAAEGRVSANIHATVSGTVKSVGPQETALGPHTPCVEIEADGQDTWVDEVRPDATEVDLSDREALLAAIAAAGIVGLGGAAFPTHVKLQPPPGVTLDTLVLNGAECEPYLTADHRLMLAYPKEIMAGVRVLMTAAGVTRAVIGVEDNKPDAIAALTAAVRDVPGVEVAACRTRYPQGAERQLLQAVLGRAVPPGKLPLHVGVVVQNVATAFAVFEAVARRRPLVGRVVTVSGRAIRTPKNLWVRIGTPLADLVTVCDGTTEALRKVVLGGPMMGKALRAIAGPVLKSTSGVLFLDGDEAPLYVERECIRCGRCVGVCPQGLVPCELAARSEYRAFEGLADALDCVECGSCQYACPAKRRLVHHLRVGKSEFRLLQKKKGGSA